MNSISLLRLEALPHTMVKNLFAAQIILENDKARDGHALLLNHQLSY